MGASFNMLPPSKLKSSPSRLRSSMRHVEHDSWLALRDAVLGVPAMLRAALASQSYSREAAIRVARIVRQLHADAVAALGDREAEDVAGATPRPLQDPPLPIIRPAAPGEASPTPPLCTGRPP